MVTEFDTGALVDAFEQFKATKASYKDGRQGMYEETLLLKILIRTGKGPFFSVVGHEKNDIHTFDV